MFVDCCGGMGVLLAVLGSLHFSSFPARGVVFRLTLFAVVLIGGGGSISSIGHFGHPGTPCSVGETDTRPAALL